MPAKRRARQLAILLTVAALLATAPGPAVGAAGAQGSGAARLARAGQDRGIAVTLLTGDKVLLRQRPGDRQAVQVVPAPATRCPAVLPDRAHPGRRARDPR